MLKVTTIDADYFDLYLDWALTLVHRNSSFNQSRFVAFKKIHHDRQLLPRNWTAAAQPGDTNAT